MRVSILSPNVFFFADDPEARRREFEEMHRMLLPYRRTSNSIEFCSTLPP